MVPWPNIVGAFMQPKERRKEVSSKYPTLMDSQSEIDVTIGREDPEED